MGGKLVRRILLGGLVFFQAEDGIRDVAVTGVQTCALPISVRARRGHSVLRAARVARSGVPLDVGGGAAPQADDAARVAVATDRPAVPEAQAGGGPAVCRDGDAETVVGWARNHAEGRGRW